MNDRLRLLYGQRRFVAGLTRAMLKQRFRGSTLGFFWTLATPAIILAVFTLVFTKILTGISIPKFPVFMMAGYLPWHFTNAALINATYSLTANARFQNLLALPREIFPLAEVLAQGANFVLTLPVLAVALAVFRVAPTSALLFLIPLLLAQFVLTLGLALGLSFFYLYWRDVKHALEAALTALFYATPIFYPITVVPEKYRVLYLLNPFASLTVGYQDAILYGRAPAAYDLLYPALLGCAILIAAWRAFAALEADFPEKI